MSRAGAARQRIEVYRPTTTKDDHYGNSVTRTLVGTYWAEMSRVSGNRGQQFEELSFSRPYLITVRSYVDIIEDDEIEFDGNVLVVQSVEQDLPKKRYTNLTATEKYNG